MTSPPPMWAHQESAVEYVLARPGSLLDAWMGTGKTRVVIEAWNKRVPLVTAIFTPLAVIPHWRREWGKYGTRPPVIADSTNHSVAKRLSTAMSAYAVAGATAAPFVFVATHAMLRNVDVRAFLLRIGVGLLVWDEVHKLKSATGKASKGAATLAEHCDWRIGLTGTPMPHSPLDLFAQLRCIAPSAYGDSWWSFRNRYAVNRPMRLRSGVTRNVPAVNTDGTLRIQNLAELESRAAPYIYRVRSDVLDLPDVLHTQLDVTLCPKAAKAYKQLEKELIAEIEEGVIVPSNALTRLLRLQQITSGVAVVGEDDDQKQHIIDTSKQEALTELLESAGGDPFVVFGRFICDLDAAHRACERAEVTSLELSGRTKELEAWQGGEAQVLVAQIQAGGVGVDLTRARYCAYMSTGFNLGDYEQSLARVHRPGQMHPVTYYHLVAQGTVDEKVGAMLEARSLSVQAVLEAIAALPISP